MPELTDFISTQQAAKLLNFHVEHVRRLMREGDLKGAKIGSAWLVLRKSVEDYIAATEGLDKHDPRRNRSPVSSLE